MKQNKAIKRDIETYPCREEGQQLLDQNRNSSTSENELLGAQVDHGGVVLGGVVQWGQELGVLDTKRE